MLLPEIRTKIFNFDEKVRLTEVPLIAVDTEGNGLTR